ncbi:hypothetical protein Efla_001452 [Eimeria flavescens]
MDVDLAVVSALQLRELLQQHCRFILVALLPCRRLLAKAEDTLKSKGADLRVEQALKELSEALSFFRSIAAADEDLKQKKQGPTDSTRPRRAARSESGGSKKHRHVSSSSSRRRRKEKENDEGPKSAAANRGAQANLETLLFDWPTADFNSSAVASASPQYGGFFWGQTQPGDAFASTGAGGAAAAGGASAAAEEKKTDHKHRASGGRAKERSKSSSTSRQAARDASSSERSSSDSDSESTSTRSRDSRDSNMSNTQQRHWKEKRRPRPRLAASEHPFTPEASASAESETSTDCSCCIRVASLRASLQLRSSAASVRLAAELSLPSYTVERIEEGPLWADAVSSDGMHKEVTWQQQISFLIKPSRGTKSRKGRDSGSRASKAIQALQQHGQMRFLVSSSGDTPHTLAGEFSFHAIASGETGLHQVGLHPLSQGGLEGSTEGGWLSFSIQVEAGNAARSSADAAAASHASLPLESQTWRTQDRGEGRENGQDSHQSRRSRAADEHGATSYADSEARCNAAQDEKAAVQQQNAVLQAHLHQQQQVLVQQHQQVQALQVDLQQANSKLRDTLQRLQAYELQHQQQLQTLHQLQQQRDAAAAHAAAEKAQLQREVLQLEDTLEAAREEEKCLQQSFQTLKKDADRLARDLQREEELRRVAESKVNKQEEMIADLTTLLNNARSRIRTERQRNEDLVSKLEGFASAPGVIFLLKSILDIILKLCDSEWLFLREVADEGKRQLLSLTWGLEKPPVYSGLRGSLEERQEQEERRYQRQKHQGDGSSCSPADARGQAEEGKVVVSREAVSHVWSAAAEVPLWSDPMVLRRVIPPSQLTEGGWEESLLLAIQKGYTALMRSEAGVSGEVLRGVLLDTKFLRVEWCSSTQEGCDSRGNFSPPSHLCGSVTVTASFAISIATDISSVPVITVALEQEVFEGGRIVLTGRPTQHPRGLYVCGQLEVSRPSREAPILLVNILTSDSLTQSLRLKLPLPAAAFCGPLRLSDVEFADVSKDTRQKYALWMLALAKVLVDISQSHFRSAVSLIALGGRFAVLPVSEETDVRAAEAAMPGTTCIHASAAFPAFDAKEEDSRRLQHPDDRLDPTSHFKGQKRILCLVELAVKQRIAAQSIHALSYRVRGPSAVLKVRCNNSALRCSTLEALMQQLMTPQQLLDAAEATLFNKRWQKREC